MHATIKLAPYFEKAVGFETEGHSKTDIIEIALAGFGDVPRERIIMVGDRVHDIVGAEKNGIHSIAVSYGYGSLEERQNAKPTYIVDSVEGLRDLLRGF